jgi:4-hydroxy-tetrahydrodipicolinate synthase
LPRPLRGIIPPLVTPLVETDRLDHAGLERLLEYVLEGGVHGVFILGTTGEGPSLSYRLRCELIDSVCAQVAGRVPVLVGVTDTSAVESINLAERAADANATAVVMSAPYYFAPTQAELLQYVRGIVAEMPLPVYLYNMPSHTKVSFSPEVVREAMDLPQIVGIKDSSGDLNYFRQLQQVVAARPDFSLLVGPESLLVETMAIGGHGGVSGGGNIWPRLLVDLYEAAVERNADRITALQYQLKQFGAIFAIDHGPAGVPKAAKCALKYLGICDDCLAPPFGRFTAEQRKQVEAIIQPLSLLAAAKNGQH